MSVATSYSFFLFLETSAIGSAKITCIWLRATGRCVEVHVIASFHVLNPRGLRNVLMNYLIQLFIKGPWVRKGNTRGPQVLVCFSFYH